MERKILSHRITMKDFCETEKKIRRKKKALSFLIFFFAIHLFGFQSQGLKESRKIKIVTSIYPLMEFAKAVSGERGEVSLLLPSGAEIHTWRPRPSDIIKLSSADLFIYIGSNLEPWLHDILKSVRNSNLRPLEASRDLPLIKEGHLNHHHAHEHGKEDPHIWLDFENDQVIIDKIADALSGIEPERSSTFRKNAILYKEKLRELDQKYKDSLKDCTHRTFIIGGHAAFGYLARRYKLHQISLYGLSPDSKPTPKQLIEVVELAKKYKIKIIFFEIYISDELAKIIAKEVGARVLVLNPGANLTKEQLRAGVTFLSIMEENLENLKDGLICN